MAKSFTLDPRIEPLFRKRAKHEKFLAIAMCAILQEGGILDQVISEFQGKDVDWHEVVGGKPLFHYNGKTKAQLRKEGIKETVLKQVAAAFQRRGLTLSEGKVATPAAKPGPVPPSAPAPVTIPPAPLTQTGAAQANQSTAADDTLITDPGDLPDAPPVNVEPTFGAASLPLSSFAGKSRKDILAVDGISPKVADQIQQALAAKPAKTDSAQ